MVRVSSNFIQQSLRQRTPFNYKNKPSAKNAVRGLSPLVGYFGYEIRSPEQTELILAKSHILGTILGVADMIMMSLFNCKILHITLAFTFHKDIYYLTLTAYICFDILVQFGNKLDVDLLSFFRTACMQ